MRVGICCCAAEFERPYLQEWWEWHREAGFDDVLVCTNNWTLDIPHPSYVHAFRADGMGIQLGMYDALADVAMRAGFDWLAVLDCDEFLYCPVGIKEWLAKTPMESSLGIPWVHFGDGGPGTPTSGSVIERFTKCEGVYNRHVKCIVNLNLARAAGQIKFINPHFAAVRKPGDRFFWLPWKDIFGNQMRGPYNAFEGRKLDPSLPFIMHFYCKTLTEWRRRRGPDHPRADSHGYVTEDWFHKENHNEVEFTGAVEMRQRWLKKDV